MYQLGGKGETVMSGIIDSAASILASHERRLEVISQNITNTSTPGYKRQIAFSQILGNEEISARLNNNSSDALSEMTQSFMPFMGQGRVKETGNPLDLAIVGSGMFLVRQGEDLFYTRSGQFSVDNGNLINAQGMTLQQNGGGDLIIETAIIEILDDGTVLDEGRPIASIPIYELNDANKQMTSLGGSIFTANTEDMSESVDSVIRQGMIESSNVELSDEMIAMSRTVRQAESGARIAQVYDQLMQQAISRFGGGR